MGKILSWVVLAALVYLAYRVSIVVNRRSAGRRAPAEASATPAQGEVMVPCAYCGVHVPLSESVSDGDRHYCCAAHRDAG